MCREALLATTGEDFTNWDEYELADFINWDEYELANVGRVLSVG